MPVNERDIQDLEKRVGDIERSSKGNIDAINKVFQHAKDYDSGLAKRLDGLEQRMDTTVKQLNQVLQHAKDYDSGLSKRLDGLEQRLDNTIKQLNQVLQHAKDYDSGLTKRLTSVEQDLKELDKRSAKGPSEASFTSLERDLNSQISSLKKQVDNLARNAKR